MSNRICEKHSLFRIQSSLHRNICKDWGRGCTVLAVTCLNSQPSRDSFEVMRATIIDSALPHAKAVAGKMRQGMEMPAFPLDPMKYSSFFPCKKVLLKLLAFFKIMSGVI